MFEFIRENYPVLFTNNDLEKFAAIGWITQEQMELIRLEG